MSGDPGPLISYDQQMAAKYPAPMRITTWDGRRTVFTEAPSTGSDTSWLWIRCDNQRLAVSADLSAAGWRALAQRADEIARFLEEQTR